MAGNNRRFAVRGAVVLAVLAGGMAAFGQPPAGGGGGAGGSNDDGPGGFMFRRPGGGGGGGGPMGQERKLVAKFDADGDGKLNIEEREAARESIKKEKASQPNRTGPGGGAGGGGVRRSGGGGPMGPGGGEDVKAAPGPRVQQSDVTPVSGDLYDPTVFRTIFLDFDHSDWEGELEDFYNTDIEVPATMTVDGKKYPGVGVHFRGASSFFGVRGGHKRSLNVSVDFTDEKLALKTPGKSSSGDAKENSYRTLNLLNSNQDPSFMSSVLYSTIANRHIPAPRANHVRVVVNGESWGVYVNIEQFNKDFVKRNFKADVTATANREAGKGGHEARWKVKGNPGARSGLEYNGDKVATYKQKYEIKSADKEEDWADLINFCKVLNTTPPAELEAALAPLLDVDATLKFLALDVVLANSDGYWTRSSDYSIYKDKAGKFHITPHDMNEAFHGSVMMPGGGMGGGRRPGAPGGGVGAPGGARPNGGGPDAGAPVGAPPADGSWEAEAQPRSRPLPPPDEMEPPAGEGGEAAPPAQEERPVRDQLRRAPRGGGGGGGGGPGGMSGTELDPLIGLNDPAKALRSKLLAVPALRERYLGYVREIAEKDLDWATLGPIVAAQRALIEQQVEADTRKLTSLEAFRAATADEVAAPASNSGGERRRETMSLRTFADKRRAYLLSYKPKEAAAAEPPKEQEQR